MRKKGLILILLIVLIPFSEAYTAVIAEGKLNSAYWKVVTSGSTVTLDKTGGIGMSSLVYVACKTEDKKNNGHVYQNNYSISLNPLKWFNRPGGHVYKSDFSNEIVIKGEEMIGYREFKFVATNKSKWTIVTWSLDHKVTPVLTFDSEGLSGITLVTDYGNFPINKNTIDEIIKYKNKLKNKKGN